MQKIVNKTTYYK